MTTTAYSQVLELIERLSPEEQEALALHLQQLVEKRRLSKAERKALFEKLVADLGPASPDFSFRREDWHDDDQR